MRASTPTTTMSFGDRLGAAHGEARVDRLLLDPVAGPRSPTIASAATSAIAEAPVSMKSRRRRRALVVSRPPATNATYRACSTHQSVGGFEGTRRLAGLVFAHPTQHLAAREPQRDAHAHPLLRPALEVDRRRRAPTVEPDPHARAVDEHRRAGDRRSDGDEQPDRERPPARAGGAREVAPAGLHAPCRVLDEVLDVDDALLRQEVRAVAAVRRVPVRAAHGGGPVVAGRAELALALAPDEPVAALPRGAARRLVAQADGRAVLAVGLVTR